VVTHVRNLWETWKELLPWVAVVREAPVVLLEFWVH
jgi:hypothetical protein